VPLVFPKVREESRTGRCRWVLVAAHLLKVTKSGSR
jgi:hypothetical protein